MDLVSADSGVACFDTCRANKQFPLKRPLPAKSSQGLDKLETYLMLSGGSRQQHPREFLSACQRTQSRSASLVKSYIAAPELFEDLPLKFFKHRTPTPQSDDLAAMHHKRRSRKRAHSTAARPSPLSRDGPGVSPASRPGVSPAFGPKVSPKTRPEVSPGSGASPAPSPRPPEFDFTLLPKPVLHPSIFDPDVPAATKTLAPSPPHSLSPRPAPPRWRTHMSPTTPLTMPFTAPLTARPHLHGRLPEEIKHSGGDVTSQTHTVTHASDAAHVSTQFDSLCPQIPRAASSALRHCPSQYMLSSSHAAVSTSPRPVSPRPTSFVPSQLASESQLLNASNYRVSPARIPTSYPQKLQSLSSLGAPASRPRSHRLSHFPYPSVASPAPTMLSPSRGLVPPSAPVLSPSPKPLSTATAGVVFSSPSPSLQALEWAKYYPVVSEAETQPRKSNLPMHLSSRTSPYVKSSPSGNSFDSLPTGTFMASLHGKEADPHSAPGERRSELITYGAGDLSATRTSPYGSNKFTEFEAELKQRQFQTHYWDVPPEFLSPPDAATAHQRTWSLDSRPPSRTNAFLSSFPLKPHLQSSRQQSRRDPFLLGRVATSPVPMSAPLESSVNLGLPSPPSLSPSPPSLSPPPQNLSPPNLSPPDRVPPNMSPPLLGLSPADFQEDDSQEGSQEVPLETNTEPINVAPVNANQESVAWQSVSLSARKSNLLFHLLRKPRRPIDAPILCSLAHSLDSSRADTPLQESALEYDTPLVTPHPLPAAALRRNSYKSSRRSQSHRSRHLLDVGVQADMRTASLRSQSSDRKPVDTSSPCESAELEPALQALVSEPVQRSKQYICKDNANVMSAADYVCPFCSCRGHNAGTPDTAALPTVTDSARYMSVAMPAPTATQPAIPNAIAYRLTKDSNLPPVAAQTSVKESDIWSDSPWPSSRTHTPTPSGRHTPTPSPSVQVTPSSRSQDVPVTPDRIVVATPTPSSESSCSAESSVSSHSSATNHSSVRDLLIVADTQISTQREDTCEFTEEDVLFSLPEVVPPCLPSSASSRSLTYQVPPLKLPPPSAPASSPPHLGDDGRSTVSLARSAETLVMQTNGKMDTPPTSHRLTGRLRHVVEQVRRRRSSSATSVDSRTPRSASRAFARASSDREDKDEREGVEEVVEPVPREETAVSKEVSAPQIEELTQVKENTDPVGTPSKEKTVAPAHVILLDADDTLIPTTEFCEEKYLDRELNDLPEDFQTQLDFLDEQLTALFEKLHAMVVLENSAIMSPSNSKNYVLSVVIITNATLSHIQSTFVKFLPKLSKFLESRSIKIEELVCSARDIWSDEFPFEHFYEFWKAWTLEDILKELKSDGVPGVTVFSIGDDEPERKAAAYVEAEMSDFVKGLKIIKMYQQPKVPQLSLQLEYVNTNIRRLIEMPQGFDLKLDLVPQEGSSTLQAKLSETSGPSSENLTLMNSPFEAGRFQVVEVSQVQPPEVPDRIEALFIQFELKYETLFDSIRTMTRKDASNFVTAVEQYQLRADLAAFAEECRQFLAVFHAFSIVAQRETSTAPAVEDLESILIMFPEVLPSDILESVANALLRSDLDSQDSQQTTDPPHQTVADLNIQQTLEELHNPSLILHALQSTVKFLIQYPNLMTTLPNLGWSPPSHEEFIVVAVKLFVVGWYSNDNNLEPV